MRGGCGDGGRGEEGGEEGWGGWGVEDALVTLGGERFARRRRRRRMACLGLGWTVVFTVVGSRTKDKMAEIVAAPQAGGSISRWLGFMGTACEANSLGLTKSRGEASWTGLQR